MCFDLNLWTAEVLEAFPCRSQSAEAENILNMISHVKLPFYQVRVIADHSQMNFGGGR